MKQEVKSAPRDPSAGAKVSAEGREGDEMTKLDRAERALWLKIAAMWDKPHPCPCCNRPVTGHRDGGLCETINAETDSAELRARMRVRIPAAYWGYVWSRTKAGARARARFARRQAAALAKPATPRAGGRGR